MNPGPRAIGLSLHCLPFSEVRPELLAIARVGGYFSVIQVTSNLLNSSNPLLSNQTGHPQTFRMAGGLGTSDCILLDPDFLGLDVHAFPHFSCGAVCFGDPTEVERGDTGQGAQHILPVGKTRAGGQPPPPPAPPSCTTSCCYLP